MKIDEILINVAITIVLIVLGLTIVLAQPLPDYTFKSPAFNGNGYSAHVLTLENQEFSRRQAIKDKLEAELEKAKNESEDTNLSKFLNNLESRIYAQISQDIATAMFADDGSAPLTGSINFQGSLISWDKTSGDIVLTVTDVNGSRSVITIPLGDFNFQ